MAVVPKDLGARGRRLWRSIATADPGAVEVGDPRRDVAMEACRAADQLDALAEVLAADGLMVRDPITGAQKIHPALVESNRLRPLLARLIVALRLPDKATGAKPQRHGIRGVQQPSRPRSGKVTALEQARRAAAG